MLLHRDRYQWRIQCGGGAGGGGVQCSPVQFEICANDQLFDVHILMNDKLFKVYILLIKC